MPADSFFDTNVLIYLARGDDRKADRAEQLLAQGGIVSVQVLNEVANVTRGKLQWSWEDIRRFIGKMLVPLEARPLTIATHEIGLGLAERYQVHLYDAMIMASALEAGSEVLYSEDMHHGLVVEGKVRIVNPFLDL